MPTCPARSTFLLEDATAGEARLRADDVVLADHAGMPDLDKAVDFGAALHARFSDRRPVDGCEALNLHVVLDDGHAGLDDLEVRPVRSLGEAVTVSADHDAVLQDHAVPDPAELAHRRMGVGVEIVADLCALINNDVRMQDGVAADRTSRSPTHANGPMDAFSPTTSRLIQSERVDARSGARRLVEQRKRAREIEVRIRGHDANDRQVGQGSGDEDRPGPAVLHLGCVLRVCQKRYLVRPRLLHPRHTGDFQR